MSVSLADNFKGSYVTGNVDHYNFRSTENSLCQLSKPRRSHAVLPTDQTQEPFRRPHSMARDRDAMNDLGSKFRPSAVNAVTEQERVQSSCSAYRSNGIQRKALSRSEIKLNVKHNGLEKAFRPQSTSKTPWHVVPLQTEDPYIDTQNGFIRKRQENKEVKPLSVTSKSVADLRPTQITTMSSVRRTYSKKARAPALIYDQETGQLHLRPQDTLRDRPPTTERRTEQSRERTYFKSVEA